MCVGSSYFKIDHRQEVWNRMLMEISFPNMLKSTNQNSSIASYHRREYREGHWVFGGIERGSNRCFMAEVQLIKDMILPGTHIISDNGALLMMSLIMNIISSIQITLTYMPKTSIVCGVGLKESFGRCTAPPEDYSIPTWLSSCGAPHLVVTNHFVQYCSTVSTVGTSYKRLFL